MSSLTIKFEYSGDEVKGSTQQRGGKSYTEVTEGDFDSKKASLLIAMRILGFSKENISKVRDVLEDKVSIKVKFDSNKFRERRIAIRCKSKEEYDNCISILFDSYKYDKGMLRSWNAIQRTYENYEDIYDVFIDCYCGSLDWGINEDCYIEDGIEIIDFPDIIFK